MATVRPWINRRKNLRAKALKQYPGRTVQWIDSQLHFTKLVHGKEISAGLVPGFEKVPKGPYMTPSEHKQKRQARRANMRNGAKLAAQ